MPEESETVNGNSAQGENNEGQNQSDAPSVEACILKTPPKSSEPDEPSLKNAQRCVIKSPVAEATEEFLAKEQESYVADDHTVAKQEKSEVEENIVPYTEPSHQVPEQEVPEAIEPTTPANSEASESGVQSTQNEESQESVAPSPEVVEAVEEPTTVNGDEVSEPDAAPQCQLADSISKGECTFEPSKSVNEPETEIHPAERNQGLIEAIAKELEEEDYKLPDVVEVKKHFEHTSGRVQNGIAATPPKKGILSTRIDAQRIKQAYEDVRFDGSETQWAVFKFEGPTIVMSATGTDFTQFKDHFGEDERAFGYIRVQTGDEMSKRAKFLLLTWIGPSVSVLKRAKMSTDKALMKEILSNFAVELQTENIADINLNNFETELDKAAGAHYGTGVRG